MKSTTQKIAELQNEIEILKKTPNAASEANKELGQLVAEINEKIKLASSIATTWDLSFDLTLVPGKDSMHFGKSEYNNTIIAWSDEYWSESSRYC